MKKLLIAVVGSVLAGVALTAAGVPPAPVPQDAKLVATGRTLFDANKCTKCHLAENRGNKNGQKLDGISAKVTADDVRKWITMPVQMTAKLPEKPEQPMKKIDLKPAEVDALVAYVMSLK